MTPPLYWTVWYNLETAYYVLLKIRLNLERNGGAMISLVMKVFEIWMLVLTVTETVEF